MNLMMCAFRCDNSERNRSNGLRGAEKQRPSVWGRTSEANELRFCEGLRIHTARCCLWFVFFFFFFFFYLAFHDRCWFTKLISLLCSLCGLTKWLLDLKKSAETRLMRPLPMTLHLFTCSICVFSRDWHELIRASVCLLSGNNAYWIEQQQQRNNEHWMKERKKDTSDSMRIPICADQMNVIIGT